MRITVVGSTDLPELLPLVRAYCDFYQVAPGDQALLEVSRVLLADPQREGLQLLARDDAGRAVGFATLYWSWQTLVAARVGVMNDLYVAAEARECASPTCALLFLDTSRPGARRWCSSAACGGAARAAAYRRRRAAAKEA